MAQKISEPLEMVGSGGVHSAEMAEFLKQARETHGESNMTFGMIQN